MLVVWRKVPESDARRVTHASSLSHSAAFCGYFLENWSSETTAGTSNGLLILCKICTCACVSVINCQEESLAARGSGQSSAVVAGPVSRHCLHPGCHQRRPSQHVSSQVQPPLVWVKIHPLRTPCRVLLWKHGWIFTRDVHPGRQICMVFYFLFFLYFTNVHNFQQAQRGGGGGGGKQLFRFVIQIFTELRIFKWIHGWLHPLCTARV